MIKLHLISFIPTTISRISHSASLLPSKLTPSLKSHTFPSSTSTISLHSSTYRYSHSHFQGCGGSLQLQNSNPRRLQLPRLLGLLHHWCLTLHLLQQGEPSPALLSSLSVTLVLLLFHESYLNTPHVALHPPLRRNCLDSGVMAGFWQGWRVLAILIALSLDLTVTRSQTIQQQVYVTQCERS